MSRAIGIASLIYGLSFLLSRLVGLVRESVIGRTLGSGADADVYWAAFVLPDFLNYLLAGGALSLVFIPIFYAHWARGDEAAAWRSLSVVGNFLLVTAAVVTLVLGLWAESLAELVAPGLDGARRIELARLIRIVLPAQAFHLIGGVLSAALQARDRHVVPAMAPLVYTGCIVGFGLALGPTMGAEGFAWGVLVGSALGPFGLALWANLRAGLRWAPVLTVRDADFRAWLLRSVPIMLGVSIVFADDWFLKRYGSTLGEGTLARLHYAKTLMKVPMGVFGLAAGMAAFPTLTRLVAEGKPTQAYATLVGSIRMMWLLAVLAQVALTVAGREVAVVIWGTRQFDDAAIGEIGTYTALICLGLWAWSAHGLLARGFYARKNTWTPTIIGSIVTVAALPFYVWAGGRGATALAWVSSASISVYGFALAGRLWWELGRGAAVGRGLFDAAYSTRAGGWSSPARSGWVWAMSCATCCRHGRRSCSVRLSAAPPSSSVWLRRGRSACPRSARWSHG